ncbi:MAG: Glycosyltransferase, group 2 family, partial [Candidatus Curtissbacteria bacterium GW2011_GWA1_40_16]
MNLKPNISIIMSVYNGQPYVKEAVKSILNQSYKNFEFIIVNDASTDGTLK